MPAYVHEIGNEMCFACRREIVDALWFCNHCGEEAYSPRSCHPLSAEKAREILEQCAKDCRELTRTYWHWDRMGELTDKLWGVLRAADFALQAFEGIVVDFEGEN